MPGGFPLGLELCAGTDYGTVTGSTSGTAVTGGASGVAGSWVQLVASTAIDACWITVALRDATGSGFNAFVDIAVGGAGSEKVIISSLGMEYTGEPHYSFPISIPAGSRISARSTSDVGVYTPHVAITLFEGAFTQMEGAAGVDVLGYSSFEGTALNNSGSSNVKGSYTQIIASTARDYIGVALYYDRGQADVISPPVRFLFDIAIGGAGSEINIVPNLAGRDLAGESTSVFFVPIPAGTRLSVRYQASGTQSLNAVLYGIYQ